MDFEQNNINKKALHPQEIGQKDIGWLIEKMTEFQEKISDIFVELRQTQQAQTHHLQSLENSLTMISVLSQELEGRKSFQNILNHRE
ncbi:MAG: hypothetical protein K2X66_00440 [Cyanobacteria bacterium]|nr:hypothetical protein [Cyanobacteriota bacterium]